MESTLKKREAYQKRVFKLRRSGFNYAEISRIIPVSEVTVRRWCINFVTSKNKNAKAMTKRKTQPLPSAKSQARDAKSQEKKIKELEAQLCQETLRADFYDEMINVAEAKFNIPIRKKAGTKR